MTDAEKITMVRSMINGIPELTDETIETYLTVAAGRIMERVYPFGSAPAEMPSKYELTQVELTVRMLARIGGEGEISHSENGVLRTYGSVDDQDILLRLTPCVGVV